MRGECENEEGGIPRGCWDGGVWSHSRDAVKERNCSCLGSWRIFKDAVAENVFIPAHKQNCFLPRIFLDWPHVVWKTLHTCLCARCLGAVVEEGACPVQDRSCAQEKAERQEHEDRTERSPAQLVDSLGRRRSEGGEDSQGDCAPPRGCCSRSRRTCMHLCHLRASPVAQLVKNLPAKHGTRLWFLDQEDPLEKEMATHCSTLAWRIPWIEEPGRLQSVGSQSWTRLWDFHFRVNSQLQRVGSSSLTRD